MTKSRNVIQRRYEWHPEVVRLFALLYPVVPTARLADAIGVSVFVAYRKADTLGLKKTEAYLASEMSGRIMRGRSDPRMVATQFAKGHVPVNKGVKGWQAGGRSVQTQFKKGGRPVNEMPIGSYRIVTDSGGRNRKTVEIKLTDLPGRNNLRWKPLHRHVWEMHNGPIPAGHVVRFKDGMHTIDPDLITIDRLEMLSKAENARRNAYHHRWPEDLKQVLRMKARLTRQINKREKANGNKEHKRSA